MNKPNEKNPSTSWMGKLKETQKHPIVILLLMLMVGTTPFLAVKIISGSIPFTNPVESHEVTNYTGICHASFTEDNIEKIDNIHKLGGRWTRTDFNWNRLERTPGVWDWDWVDDEVQALTKENIMIEALLLYDNDAVQQYSNESDVRYIHPNDVPLFLNYVNKTVRRYYQYVSAWEIWNEPNIPKFWTGPKEDFYYLIEESLLLIEEIENDLDVEITVLAPSATGGVMGYIPFEFEEYLKRGLGPYLDGMNFHVYQHNAESLKQAIMDFQAIMIEYDYQGELWLTEIGNPTGGEYAWQVNQQMLADNIIKTFCISAALGVDKVIWYNYKDSEASDWYSSEAFFGLLYANQTWKPGAYAFSLFNEHCDNSTYNPNLIELTGSLNKNDYVFTPFARENGMISLIGWYDPLLPVDHGKFTLDFSQIEGEITIYNIYTGNSTTITGESIEIDSHPVLLTFQAKSPTDPIKIIINDPVLIQSIIPSISIGFVGCVFLVIFREKKKEKEM